MAKIKIYTDGAVKNGGSEGTMGMAAILIYTKSDGDPKLLSVSSSEQADYATNNKAELKAMLLGIEHIKKELRHKVELVIYSDSQWAIKSITGEFKAVKNLDLIHKARELLQEFSKHEFIWVEGHNGDQWNEEANKLAQKAAGTWKR